MEQYRIQSGLIKMGVIFHTNTERASFQPFEGGLEVLLGNVYSEVTQLHHYASLVLVIMRDPVDDLFTALKARQKLVGRSWCSERAVGRRRISPRHGGNCGLRRPQFCPCAKRARTCYKRSTVQARKDRAE